MHSHFTCTDNIMINVVTPLSISRNNLIKFVPITGGNPYKAVKTSKRFTCVFEK